MESPVNPFVLDARPRGLRRWIPGLAVLGGYSRAWFARDVVAGLALTAVLVPVGMGYAAAAGLPAIYGLYATIVPLLAYAVFGPSRILVLGPDSALAALIAATVLPLAAGDAARAVALAGLLAILSGALCILAGLARFGFITDLLSKPIRYGYLNGIALTVLVGQLPKLFGFSASGDSLAQQAIGVARGVLGGRTNATACAIGVVLPRRDPRLPAVGAEDPRRPGRRRRRDACGRRCFDLAARAGVAVVGSLPQGLPAFQMPARRPRPVGHAPGRRRRDRPGLVRRHERALAHLRAARRLRGRPEPGARRPRRRERGAGLFQGFSVSSSASRTPVAESAGAKTQVTGVVGALRSRCCWSSPRRCCATCRTPPSAPWSSPRALSLVDIRGIVRLYRLRRSEFVLSIVCFLGVALLGVIQGIFVAVGLSLLAFVWRAWRPYDAVLGRVDGLKGYHDISRHPEAKRIPGLVLFRWDAPLFFANAEIFLEHVLRAVAAAPTPTKWVVVAAEPVTDVDITAADALAELDEKLHEAGIELCFAEMKGPVKDRLKRYGLFTKLGAENFFPTIDQAVDRYLEVHPVEWRDWDE